MELSMNKQKVISRKSFFQIVTGVILGLVAWVWYNLTNFQTEFENRMEFRHSQDIPMGISFFDMYYICRNDQSIRAFSTKCTHAGCRIGTNTGTVLQCNCHGSQFDAKTGKPLKGPAIKPLQEIECQFDEVKGQWVVRLKPLNPETV